MSENSEIRYLPRPKGIPTVNPSQMTPEAVVAYVDFQIRSTRPMNLHYKKEGRVHIIPAGAFRRVAEGSLEDKEAFLEKTVISLKDATRAELHNPSKRRTRSTA